MLRECREYFIDEARQFANEYTLAIATTSAAKRRYAYPEPGEPNWLRIEREKALVMARRRGDDATKLFIGFEVDGTQVYRDEYILILKS